MPDEYDRKLHKIVAAFREGHLTQEEFDEAMTELHLQERTRLDREAEAKTN